MVDFSALSSAICECFFMNLVKERVQLAEIVAAIRAAGEPPLSVVGDFPARSPCWDAVLEEL